MSSSHKLNALCYRDEHFIITFHVVNSMTESTQ
jgi:hypothetical protein